MLATVVLALLGSPVSAGAVGCSTTNLPVPPSASEGASADGIRAAGTYVGWSNSPQQGQQWDNGVVSSLPINGYAVNASGLVVGTAISGYRAARVQIGGAVQYGLASTGMNDVNASGHAVGSLLTVSLLPNRRKALWWHPNEAQPRELPGPELTGATAIDDLGYKVGTGETRQGARSWIVWGANGEIVRQFGPYAAGQTWISLHDIDDGVAVATRWPASGPKDIVLVDVVTGAISPVPGTSGFEAQEISNGSVVGMDANLQFALWHLGTRYDLTVSRPTPHTVADLEVFGTTAVVSGFRLLQSSGSFKTPTIWRCG